MVPDQQAASSAAGIYVNVFHMSHIGKLTGLGSIAGAIFSLIMDPLMRVVNNQLEGNPYQVTCTAKLKIQFWRIWTLKQSVLKLNILAKYNSTVCLPCWWSPTYLPALVCKQNRARVQEGRGAKLD